jgi:hypothetical protein
MSLGVISDIKAISFWVFTSITITIVGVICEKGIIDLTPTFEIQTDTYGLFNT